MCRAHISLRTFKPTSSQSEEAGWLRRTILNLAIGVNLRPVLRLRQRLVCGRTIRAVVVERDAAVVLVGAESLLLTLQLAACQRAARKGVLQIACDSSSIAGARSSGGRGGRCLCLSDICHGCRDFRSSDSRILHAVLIHLGSAEAGARGRVVRATVGVIVGGGTVPMLVKVEKA